jgi:DNA-binding transcriptional ArsR family regulator
MRSLPPALRRRVADYSFLYRNYFPDAVLPPPGGEYGSFEAELERLLALPPNDLTLELTRPVWDHGGVRDARKLRSRRVRDGAAANAERLGGSGDLARLAFEQPLEFARGLADLLHDYWERAFAREWERLEPKLADAVTEAGHTIARDGVYALLAGLSRQLVVNPRRSVFGKDVPHQHRVEPDEDNPVVFVPSAYVWPHVFLNCDAPWPLAVVYPAPFVVREARPAIPSADLLRVLRALADDTRLRALQLIAEQPRSTQELAPLVGLTEAGLSKHLRLLHEAGILEARREGYYVLYSLVPERVEPLSQAVLAYLSRS